MMEDYRFINKQTHVVDVRKWHYFKNGLLLQDVLGKSLSNEIVIREIQKCDTLVLFGTDNDCIALENQIRR